MSVSPNTSSSEIHDHATDGAPRTRLPTLVEVLFRRRTLPPVDLYSFYIYMRDQERSVDYLDFWLDISQHMSLCRHYIERRWSILLDLPSSSDKDKEDSGLEEKHELTQISEDGDPQSSNANETSQIKQAPPQQHHPSHSMSERQQRESLLASVDDDRRRFSVLLRNDDRRNDDSRSLSSAHDSVSNSSQARPTTSRSGGSRQAKNAVMRGDIRACAERIVYTYLIPGAEREIILPEAITSEVVRLVEEEGRDDPEVFDQAKDYVFQAMEKDAFPGFLHAKALGNLVPADKFVRLVCALTAFGGAFWAAWYLLLTNSPRQTRCWIILPFSFAGYLVSSWQYNLDPIAAILGYSEETFMHWSRIEEPFVRGLLVSRSLAALAVGLLITVALCVLFIFVPGKHL